MNKYVLLSYKNYLIIFLLCLIFPLLITRYTLVLSLIVVGIGGMLVIRRKSLGYFLFIALFSCIPSQFGGDANISTFNIVNRYCEYFPILLSLLYIPFVKKSGFLRNELSLFFLLVILCIFWYIYTLNEGELIILLKYGLFLSILILFYHSSTRRQEFYLMFDAVALVAGVYMAIEFFLRYNPYQDFINYGSEGIDEFDVAKAFRPNGILCNPLTTSIVFLMELNFLFVRYLEKKKMNYLMLFLTFVFCLLCVSRTAILGAIIITLTSFYLRTKTTKKIPWKLYTSIILGTALVVSVFGIALDYLMLRFSDGGLDVGITSRMSNYTSVFNLLCDHPFGVGSTNLIDIIEKRYAGAGWIPGFKTLDNFFLTYFGEYGLLSIIPFLFFFYWFIYARKRKTNIVSYYQAILLLITFFFVSFSYNWETYNFILASLGGIIGVVIRDLNNKEIDESLSCNSNI